MKKLLALILALAMSLSCLCSGALAAELSTEAPVEESSLSAEVFPEGESSAEEGEEELTVQEDSAEAEDTDESAPAQAENEEEALKPQAEAVYVLMNIPYSEFYKSELAEGSVDVVSAATAVKSRNKGLAGGSYHAAESQGVDGVVYPVKVDKSDLSGLTQVTDATSVTLSYNLRGTDMTDTLTGKDALIEAPAHAYYLLSEKPALSKTATKKDGKWSFTAVSGRAVTSEAELTMSTGGHHTFYEFNGPSVLAEGETLNAVVLTTADGKTYGLRHVTEIWRNGLQLGWDETDGYEGLSGATITKITYLTTEHKYEVTTNLYVPINVSFDLTVADALATAGRTTITSKLPADFQAEFAVKDHADFVVSGSSITFPTDAAIGAYTLSVTDKGGKYAPFDVTFELKSDKVLAVYDAKAKALVAAEGVSAEDFAAFIKGISTVTVNDQVYNASGRHAVVIVKEDGTLDLTAAGATESMAYQFDVHVPGYDSITFSIDQRKANPLKVTASAKSVKVKAVKKKAQVLSVLSVKKNQGKVTYSVTGGDAKSKKALSVNKKNGKVTVKKGTKKGKYTVKVKVAAKGNDSYTAGSKTVNVTVTVK